MLADAAELVHRAERAHLRVVFDDDVAGKRRAIHQNIEIPQLTIVPHVRVRHDQIVAAHARDAAALHRAAIHRGKFAELVVVAHFDGNALAFVSEVLRIATHHREGIEVTLYTYSRGAAHDG